MGGGITSQIISSKKLANKEEIQIQDRIYLSKGEVGKGVYSTNYLLENQNCIENVVLRKFRAPKNVDEKAENIAEAIQLEFNTVKDISSNNMLKFYVAINSNSYILEYANQGTVAELMQNPNGYSEKYNIKLTTSFLFDLVIGIFKGLSDLKEQKGIKHYDLKPQNIFISDSVAKIFGIGYKNIFKKAKPHLKEKAIREVILNYPTGENVYDAGIITCQLLFPLEDVTTSSSISNKFYQKFKYNYPDLIHRFHMKFFNASEDKRIKINQAIEELTILKNDRNIHLFIYECYKNKGKFDEQFINFSEYSYQQDAVKEQNFVQQPPQPVIVAQSSKRQSSTQVRSSYIIQAAPTVVVQPTSISQQPICSTSVQSPYNQVYEQPRQSTSYQAGSYQVPYQTVVRASYNPDVQYQNSPYQQVQQTYVDPYTPIQNINNNATPIKNIKKVYKQQQIEEEHIYYSLKDPFQNDYIKIVQLIPKLKIMNTEKLQFIGNDNTKLTKSVFDLTQNTVLTPFNLKQSISAEGDSNMSRITEKIDEKESEDNMDDMLITLQAKQGSNEKANSGDEQLPCSCLEEKLCFEELIYSENFTHNISYFIFQDTSSLLNGIQILLNEYENNPKCAVLLFSIIYSTYKLEQEQTKDDKEYLTKLEQCIQLGDKRIQAEVLAFKAYLITQQSSSLNIEKQKDFAKQADQLINEAEKLNSSSSFVLLQKGNITKEFNKKISIYEEALILNRNNYECLLQLYDAFHKQKNYQKAEFYISIVPSKYQFYNSTIERKISNLQARQLWQKLHAYLISLPATLLMSQNMIINLSECLIELKDFEKLEIQMKNVIQEQKKKCHPIQQFCHFLCSENLLDKAIACYERFKDSKIFDSQLSYTLCTILIKENRQDKAKQYLQEVLKSQETQEDYEIRALALKQLGFKDKYTQYALEKIKLYPWNIEFKSEYINFLYQEKKFEEIINILNKIVIYSKDFPRNLLQYLIFSYLKLGQNQIAVEILKTYIDNIIIFLENSALINFFKLLFTELQGSNEDEKKLYQTLAEKVIEGVKSCESQYFYFNYYYSLHLIQEKQVKKAISAFLKNPIFSGGQYEVSECVSVFQLLLEQISLLEEIKNESNKTILHSLIKKSYIFGCLLVESGKHLYEGFFLDYQTISKRTKELKLSEINQNI